MNVVIASEAKQSRRRPRSGLLRFTRNDEAFSRRPFAPESCQPCHVKNEDQEACEKAQGVGPRFLKGLRRLRHFHSNDDKNRKQDADRRW
jgi:hypothetical protein